MGRAALDSKVDTPSDNSPANAKRHYERYMVLARAAASGADTLEAENLLSASRALLEIDGGPAAAGKRMSAMRSGPATRQGAKRAAEMVEPGLARE